MAEAPAPVGDAWVAPVPSDEDLLWMFQSVAAVATSTRTADDMSVS